MKTWQKFCEQKLEAWTPENAASMQNTINNMNDPMFKQAAQRMQMPMSQQAAARQSDVQAKFNQQNQQIQQQTTARHQQTMQMLKNTFSQMGIHPTVQQQLFQILNQAGQTGQSQ